MEIIANKFLRIGETVINISDIMSIDHDDYNNTSIIKLNCNFTYYSDTPAKEIVNFLKQNYHKKQWQ